MGGPKVKEDHSNFGEIFDKFSIGILIYDREGKLVDANKSVLKIAGIPRLEDISGVNLFEITFIAQKKEKLVKEGSIRFQSPVYFEDIKSAGFYTPTKSGTALIDWTISTSDAGFLVQIQDITEHKFEEFLQSEEKYRSLFDEDLTGDFIATLDGKILECNPAFAEIYGFNNCEDACGSDFSQFNPFDWPYILTRLRSEGKIQGYQSWQRRSDGLRIHVVANVVGIFDDSGELIQVRGYVFDDTDRKKAEEKLIHSKRQITRILESIKDGFIVLNYYWNFTYVNQSAAQYLGIESDDLVGQNLWERFPELTGTIYEIVFRRARDEQKIQYLEGPGIHVNDHRLDVSVYPLDEGISVYWRDITQHKPEKIRTINSH